MSDPLAEIASGLERLAAKAHAARLNPPQRPDDDGWRPSGLLIALGDQVDDLELLEERDAWPDVPARD